MLRSRNLEPNGSCPLCDDPGYIRPSEQFDGFNVICDRCGYFRLETGALQGFERQRHLLSALTRRATNPQLSVELRLAITRDNIAALLDGAQLPGGLLDNLDRTLEYVRAHQDRSDAFPEYRDLVKSDYPLVFARDGDEFLHFLRTLAEQGLLEEPPGRDPQRRTSFRITPAGWQRVREIGLSGSDPNRAFVAMWFDSKLESAWSDGIRPALEALGFYPVRIDLTHGDDKIDDRIIAEIRRSGLLIADFTGHRGGVYFEAGFAMGLGIPVVWTCRRDEHQETHFDTRQYQHVLWDTPEDLRKQLINHIAARASGHHLPP